MLYTVVVFYYAGVNKQLEQTKTSQNMRQFTVKSKIQTELLIWIKDTCVTVYCSEADS